MTAISAYIEKEKENKKKREDAIDHLRCKLKPKLDLSSQNDERVVEEFLGFFRK